MASSKLQGELKKRGDFESLQQEVMLNLMRTNDRIQIRFARLFREHGLTEAQYNILRILRGENAPLPVLEIASRTITVVPGITGLIDRLEKGGFVERRRCLEDRRVVFVAIMPKGLTTLTSLDDPVSDLHQRLLLCINQDDLQELNRLLEIARDSVEAEAGE